MNQSTSFSRDDSRVKPTLARRFFGAMLRYLLLKPLHFLYEQLSNPRHCGYY